MNNEQTTYDQVTIADQVLELVRFDFSISRRGFVQGLGAGLLLTAMVGPAFAQQRGRGGRGGLEGGIAGAGATNLGARLHIGTDGIFTVMTGKVEGGQGARAEISQAAAEELGVGIDRIRLIMADTGLVPDDGGTVGSQTTPRTLPPVRQACAAVKRLLLDYAAKTWSVARDEVKFKNGAAFDSTGNRQFSYTDLASADASAGIFKQAVPNNATITPAADWKVMGIGTARPNAPDLVTGRHKYPSAVIRPGMLYGKILRAPVYNAKLTSVDLSAAKAMEGVVAFQDGDFVAVAAPTTYQASKAIAEVEKTAKWDRSPHPAASELPRYLRQHAQGGIPANPYTQEMNSAAKSLTASYDVAYVQHCPMEPRAAVAEFQDDKLTVWTATQMPFGVRAEIARNLQIPADSVRVIVPDFGGGFGGKHTGECAVEAAHLARMARKPIALHWTREEEFTWAYFRPAAAIDIQASLDASGTITSWHHININSGNQGIDSPYRIAKSRSQYVQSAPPLRHGSYRALATTANNFARESFMDELAHETGKDPLEFRVAHLENPRLRAVLEDAAKRFDWATKRARKDQPNVGVGLACGTDKGGFVATCAEVLVDKTTRQITVRHIAHSFECGAIVNPTNLIAQVRGAVIQGLGPALREAMDFEGGVMLNPSFFAYKVPRFADVPELDVNLMNRPDLPSAGAGETPVISVAPAIANAVFHTTGQRIRQMPIRLEA